MMAASRTGENNFILISPVKFRERHDGVQDYCQEDNRRCPYLEASIGAESPNNYEFVGWFVHRLIRRRSLHPSEYPLVMIGRNLYP